MRHCVPFALCQAAEHFVLLSTVWTCLGLHVKCPIFLCDFNQIWSFLTEFSKSPQYKISRKCVQCEPRFYMRKDGRTDMKKYAFFFYLFYSWHRATAVGTSHETRLVQCNKFNTDNLYYVLNLVEIRLGPSVTKHTLMGAKIHTEGGQPDRTAAVSILRFKSPFAKNCKMRIIVPSNMFASNNSYFNGQIFTKFRIGVYMSRKVKFG
jgi:hypothetical protein